MDAGMKSNAGTEQKEQKVIAVCGVKNSGKTTLLLKLVRAFSDRGLKTAVIKHDGHDFSCDIPGTDSFKLKEAGAYGTAVYSKERVFVHRTGMGEGAEQLIAMFPEADVIFLEGLKGSGYPKIEVIREGVSEEPVSDPAGRFLIVTDREPSAYAEETAGFDDIGKIAERIMKAAIRPAGRQGKEGYGMRQMKTTEAVGQVLCHDVTRIVKGVTKDAAFRKGHIIREEDIPVLLSMGKDSVYIWEKDGHMLHEDEAAQILYGLCAGNHMRPSEVKEGKIEIIAECDGLFKVDRKRLDRVNSAGEMMIASRHGDFPVKAGDKLAGTRIIPLVIEKEKLEAVKRDCAGAPIFALKPFLKKKAGIVTTGNEVYHGRIADTFTSVVEEKLMEYGVRVIGREVSDDDHKRITGCIEKLLEKGADMILCTGGMSVDPDDRTPLAIKNTGAKIVTYGAPVLPGAMFLLAYMKGDIPVMGLPGCVMYAKRTIFDLVLPRILAGERLSAKDIAVLGEGGLCLSCPVCTFPNCGFGKGGQGWDGRIY